MASSEDRTGLPALIKCGASLAAATSVADGILLAAAAEPIAVCVLAVSPALRKDVLHAIRVAAISIVITAATPSRHGVLETY